MSPLEGRIAIVTGAGRSIGRAIAQLFAREGARVVVATRTPERAEETAKLIATEGGSAWPYPIDLADGRAIPRLVEETVRHYGGVDVVVHNAAVYPFHTIAELPDHVLDETLSVNLKACFTLTRAAAPWMQRKKWGRILVTSSVTGPRVALPGLAHYAASKSGVNGFLRAAALEYAKDGITVNGVEPGFVLNEALAAEGNEEGRRHLARLVPMGRLGRPEEVAHAMLFLASEQAAYVTGQTLVVDGGSTLPETPLVGPG